MRTNEKQDQPEKEVKANQKNNSNRLPRMDQEYETQRGRSMPSLMDAKHFVEENKHVYCRLHCSFFIIDLTRLYGEVSIATIPISYLSRSKRRKVSYLATPFRPEEK
jgi:hypothetical protein